MTIGYDTVIPITQTSTTHLSASNKAFKLSTVLCAPAIKRNLFSVSQFFQDNLTSIEFFPLNFLVKDLTMGTPLLCSPNIVGLLEWP